LCLVGSKKINEEELQELFPEGLYKSLSFQNLPCFDTVGWAAGRASGL